MEDINVTDSTIGCDMKLFNQCFNLLSNINNRNCIYPLEVSAPKNSEFFKLQSKIHIRTIHMKPDNCNKQNINRSFDRNSPYRRSLSEEYWFTRCNKPLRHGSCNCSFRKSQRLSHNKEIINEQPNIRKLKINVKIINIETYVERLMQETFLQAFQENFILNAQTKGNNCFDNFAYLDDDMKDIKFRKNVNVININEESDNNKYSFTKKKCCDHKIGIGKTKPLILLFHGIGSSADIWEQLINCLVNKGHEVVAPDMLGHGYSSTPNKTNLYSFVNLLNNAIAIFDHYVTEHASQSCIIIAHSFGCSIATALYKFRSQQILQLILISGGGPTPLAASVRDHELSPFNCAEFFFKPLIICGLKRRFFYSSRGKHFIPCTSENAVPAFVTQSIAFGQNWPEGDATYHRRILIPTLLVYGLQDSKVTLVQECEMERTIPRAFLELIPDAGHMVMLDTPEQLAHMILCFIEWWAN